MLKAVKKKCPILKWLQTLGYLLYEILRMSNLSCGSCKIVTDGLICLFLCHQRYLQRWVTCQELENVRYPCSLSVSENLCMSYFIIINPSTTGMLEDLSKQRKMIYLPSKYLLFWYGIEGTLALQFILLPEFNLLFWDKAVLCLAWDN